MATPWSLSDLYNIYAGGIAADDAGNRPGLMSRAEFDALSEQRRMSLASEYGSNFGTNIFQDQSGNMVGYGDPRFIEQGGWYNPSGMTRDNGRFSINSGSVNQDRLNDIQNATDRSGFFSGTPLQNIMRGAGIVLGVGGLNNYLTSGSMFGGTSGGQGLLAESVAPQVTEPMMGSPFGGGAIGGGALAESVAPTVTESMAAAPNLGGNSWLSSISNAFGGANPWRLGASGISALGGLLGGRPAQPGGSVGFSGGLLSGFGSAPRAQQGNYSPNPYTMAQLNRLYGGI